MASKNYSKKKIQDTEKSGFGKYTEENGGGTPIGGVYGGGDGRGIWKKNGSPGHRDSQPRTNDGKFTYNSVNGKTISTNKSRGKTVNPLLTGGVNGIKISDVEKEFGTEQGAIWDKYKDKWYRKGGEIVTTDLKTRVSAEAIWEVAKRKYDVVKGEFEEESSTFDTTKKGRKSLDEQKAVQVAKTTGEEAPVISSKTGGIKVKPGISLPKVSSTIVKPYRKVSFNAFPTVAPVSAPVSNAPVSSSSSLTHTKEELEEGRQALIAAGHDVSGLTDEQLDQKWDSWFE